ncbi:hypothetical protein GCM10010124_02310 [Pilimelia terevasa]|uniref:Peptidase S74 domain-containing protein n=1 Tax=Pilimelia terevasa TaxID=53372 RepID=A0A8J3BIR6_9ACTN|nr:tail fiber domain-containing protein [Pilimelia terevasa]GGK13264.1 hypothetical protein GCM10010124_02310 [Pilimelia terevasa]
MPITAYPFEDVETNETDYSRLFRELQDSGIADSIGGPGFAVSADSAGLKANIQPGFGLLRGHAVRSTDIESVELSAGTGAARVDRVVLRLDPAENSIRPAVVEGTPGGGLPALTQSDTGIFEEPLARINVGPTAASIAPENVVDDRNFLGSRVGVWTTLTRPVAPRRSRFGLNITSGRWEWWTGAEWSDITGTPGAHTHAATDITAGTLPIARLPTGTTDTTVALGNHTHPAPTWTSISGKPAKFPPTDHDHDPPRTVTRANGSDRVHGNTPQGSGWFAVWVDGNKNFCHNTSSRRYKTNIRELHLDPANVLALRPVAYDRKPTRDDETGQWQDGPKGEIGLIAEEVHEHLPQLVQWLDRGDGAGAQIEALRYDLLPVAMLTVLKDQAARIDALEACVRELLHR